MNDESRAYKKDLGVRWVRGESGTTYLCTVSTIKDFRYLGESDLRSTCVDESANPQNE